MEVLDIGCNAGFYSLELAKRNANVTAIDVDLHYLKQAEFVTSLYDLQDHINFYQMQVYDLAKLDKQFDIILFMGVFYHLRYPLLAMDIITPKVKKYLIFQSLSLEQEEDHQPVGNFYFDQRHLMLEKGWPSMAFIENNFAGDPTNWWVPNPAAIKAMARSCGLRLLHQPEREIYIFEPDPQKTSILEGWDRSELLSALGKDWKDEVAVKTGKYS
jgi:tRNA (mo5U34)-methyltransferase